MLESSSTSAESFGRSCRRQSVGRKKKNLTVSIKFALPCSKRLVQLIVELPAWRCQMEQIQGWEEGGLTFGAEATLNYRSTEGCATMGKGRTHLFVKVNHGGRRKLWCSHRCGLSEHVAMGAAIQGITPPVTRNWTSPHTYSCAF